MKPEFICLKDLNPPERNVRVHPEGQIEELARSVKMFGQTRPIIIDDAGTILVGNGLVSALYRLGETHGFVLRMPGLSEADKRKLILADNKIFQLGIDDHASIMQLVKELDGDFDIPGFDEELLSRLTAEVNQATAQSMNDYGHITDVERGQFSEKETPRGSMDADASEIRATGEVVCPYCGHTFTP